MPSYPEGTFFGGPYNKDYNILGSILGHPNLGKLPNTQYLGTWVLGNSNYSTGFGQVYDYWVLGRLGLGFIYTAKDEFRALHICDD